jgi:tetratricopeptide (TPR) repeat protein
MLRSRLLLNVFALWIAVETPLFAQTNLDTSAIGYDYFTAERDGVKDYLNNMTINHLKKVPGWIQQGRIGNAVDDLKYVLDRFPNNPQALQLLGMVARLAKNQALAIVYFERAIKQFPQYAITHAQYGLYLVSNGNIDEGLERFNQSIAIDPKLPAGHAGLAHAYAKKGDLTKAREAADKARELGFTGQLPAGL